MQEIRAKLMSTSLPPEIVTEILTRLNFRTLALCKAVCKEWRYLISDPSFRIRFSTWKLGTILMWPNPRSTTRPCIQLNTFDSAGNKTQIRLKIGQRSNSLRPCLAGSCNGILYIQNPNSDARLLNPTIRSSTRIPPHGLQLFSAIATGLGYDHTTDDYKALVIIEESVNSTIGVRIISLRQNLWRKIPILNKDQQLATCIFGDPKRLCKHTYSSYAHTSGTTINGGSPHWTGRRSNGAPVLIRFDMVREEFVDVGLPAEAEKAEAFEFGELEGRVCVTFKGKNGISLEGWSKKLDDDNESWTKLFSFSPTIPFETLKPVWGDLKGLGEVVMVLDKNCSLCKFNINDNSRQIILGLEVSGYAHYIESPTCPWNSKLIS